MNTRTCLEADLTGVDVVTLYVLPELTAKLMPKLKKLRAGSRIVLHQFALPGLHADQIITMKSTEDGAEHTIRLYKLPLDR